MIYFGVWRIILNVHIFDLLSVRKMFQLKVFNCLQEGISLMNFQ